MMATKRGFTGWRSISKVEEAAYDTAATIASTYRNSADPINLQVELVNGTDLVGTEAEEADEQEIVAQHAEGSESLPRLRPNEAALFLAYLLGNVNQSPADEPGAGYYTHTITPFPVTYTNGAQDGSGGSPLTTITVEDTSSWPSSGTLVNAATGNAWTYSGKTATTFTGVNNCTDNIADNQFLSLQQPDYDYTLPSFTVLDYIGATLKKQWAGCILPQFEIAADRKGYIRGAGRIMASGTVTSPATARPAEISEVYLKIGDATFTIGGTWDGRTFSGGTSINAKIKGFRWVGTNDIPDDLVYGVGGSTQMTKAERLRRRQELQIVVEFEDQTEQDYVTNQTELNLKVNMAGASGSYAVNLILPQFRFNSSPVSGGTGVLIRTLDAAVQTDATYGSVLFQVINGQVDYLHA